jgi:DNA-binding NarL/FixJ family response regulator
MATRVLLGIGQRLYRQTLRETIVQRLGVDVVAETASGRELIVQAGELSPDLVILELGLKDLNGIEAIRQLRSEHPHLPVLAISAHSDHALVMRVLRAGARAFLLSGGTVEELERSIQITLDGRIYLSPELEGAIAQALVEPGAVNTVLSPREIEVLQLIAEGKSTRDVAEMLSVSTKTVETHRQHIMAKVRLYSVAELTKYAIREGITTITS